MIRIIHYKNDSHKAARILKENERMLYQGNSFLIEKDNEGREYIPYENVLYVCTEVVLHPIDYMPETELYATKIIFKDHPSLDIKTSTIPYTYGLYFVTWKRHYYPYMRSTIQRELWIPVSNVISIEQTKLDPIKKKTTPKLNVTGKGQPAAKEQSSKSKENEPVEIILTLTSCEGCPYFLSEREYTADSWENLYIWKCKDQRNRRIGGMETFDPKPPIPVWCNKRAKK